MKNEAPARDAFEVYAESFECLVSSAEPLLGRIEDAFRAGYSAGRRAERETPNRLVIDTTDARMTPIQNSAAAVAMPRFKPFVPAPGFCSCRHKVPLNADGSNPCSCCNEPVLELPDDQD